jgi:hypothetical protein
VCEPTSRRTSAIDHRGCDGGIADATAQPAGLPAPIDEQRIVFEVDREPRAAERRPAKRMDATDAKGSLVIVCEGRGCAEGVVGGVACTMTMDTQNAHATQ